MMACMADTKRGVEGERKRRKVKYNKNVFQEETVF